MDGNMICLAYKLTGTSALKEAGKAVEISSRIKVGGSTVGFGDPLPVARSAKAASLSLVLEPDGEVFISVVSGNIEFVTTDGKTATTSNEVDHPTAFRSANEVIIGYVKSTSTGAADRTGSTPFTLGGPLATKDVGTLKIEDGQFSASLSSTSKVYLGGIDAIATVENVSDTWTATWNLDNLSLEGLTKAITNAAGDPTGEPRYTPIIIRADGATMIDSGTDDDPIGTLDVKLGGTTAMTDEPVTSALRRILNDGKVCYAYNIPSPTGAEDILTLRITNDSDQAGILMGTLYNEEGEELGKSLDLLAGHIDYTKSPPVERATLTLPNPLELQPRETVILTSKNIATVFGQTDWQGDRYVLKIQSTIRKIEVFNLLRNVHNTSLQPLSNVSTSAKGVECSPVP
jgi:hypothetical protein